MYLEYDSERLTAFVFCIEQVWKNYICQVSSSEICITPGRLTPSLYNQMESAVNLSYGLNRYGPFLVNLEDCTFVRETFTKISHSYCPDLRRYSQWIYIGLVIVSAAVMLSLIFWVIYARERRHRVYTKQFMSSLEGPGKASWRCPNLVIRLLIISSPYPGSLAMRVFLCIMLSILRLEYRYFVSALLSTDPFLMTCSFLPFCFRMF
jgi:hypothetical protein